MFIQAAGTNVVDDLRGRILSLELPPGTSLSRAELSARYGISSTPLRDALLRLQEEGLIVVRPQARTSVSLIDLDQARQVHVLRSAVEVEIVSQLTRNPSTRLLEELSSLIELQAEEAACSNLAGFYKLDLAFHQMLYRQADLTEVHRVIRRESVHIDRLRALHLMRAEKAQQILSDHRSIRSAIAEIDPVRAGEAMRQHLSQSIQLGPQLTSEKPHYFKVSKGEYL